jgi:hypothetical protein
MIGNNEAWDGISLHRIALGGVGGQRQGQATLGAGRVYG